MKFWFENSYFHPGDTAPEVQSKLESLVEDLGLDYFGYGLLRPLESGVLEMGTSALGNYPVEFIDRYIQGRYHLIDPVCELSVRMNRPFYWGPGRFLRAFRKPQRRVLDEARAFGIVYGLAIPVHGPNGAVGTFVVATEHAKRLLDAVGGEYQRLIAAAYDAHDFAVGAVTGALEGDVVESLLTVRERECLLWTAEGKTAAEVAAVLGLSVSTVNHHMSAAAGKLGCVNKHHAVVRALRAGLI